MKATRRLFLFLLALTALPHPSQAQEQPPALPETISPAEPDAPSASCHSEDADLEAALQDLKTQAGAGKAEATRQVYLRYAARGHMEQARAWAARYLAQLEKKAEEKKAPHAMLTLAKSHLTGRDFATPDTAKAVTWLLRAADAGEPTAAYILGDIYAQQGDVEMSQQAYARAYEAYRKLAEKQPNNSNVTYWLGYMQQNGLGTGADAAAGIALLEKAAEMGSPWAYTQLFKTYEKGIGTEKNEARAIAYAQKLADTGQDGLMAYVTAIAYLDGRAVEKNEQLGEKYLNMAVAANIPDAIARKAHRLQQAGKPAEALPLYTQAASMGQPDATIELALMLLYGNGVEKDEARGLAYLQTANHRLGAPHAPYELARYYESIGEQDIADDWYITASDAGDLKAMARRGLLHLNPFSRVSWNPTLAWQWWRTGADKGDADCRLCKNLFLYAFCPLVLIIVFGLPVLLVRRLARGAEAAEAGSNQKQ